MDNNKFDDINDFLQLYNAKISKSHLQQSQKDNLQKIESIKEEDDDPKPDPQLTPSISVQRHNKSSNQHAKLNNDNISIKTDISEISSPQQRVHDNKSFTTSRILHQLREYSSG